MDKKEINREGYAQKDIDKINQSIPFVDTKIFWKEDYGWTSLYWENLRKTGWTLVRSKDDPDTLIAIDEEGHECLLASPDRIALLKLLSNYLLGPIS